MSFGVTGGPYQPTGHIQLVTGMADHGLDIQDAIERPRSFVRDGMLQLEPALAGIGTALAALGHDVVDAPSPVGGAHGITIDWEVGVLTGGSDSRKDGCALAF
jgi:gamma-glutamyltranspeptidase/glutathione hydrolase